MLAPPSASLEAPGSPKGGSGYLKAKIGGFDCHVLVDTGASRSIIPKQMWLTITEGGCELSEFTGSAMAANGAGMTIMGCWQTVCQFDALALVGNFLVSDSPFDEILLGFDFLSQYGAVVDLGGKQCRIMGKQFPLIDINPSSEPQIVVVQSDTLVPPRSEVIIWGQVQNKWGDYAEGLLEPSTGISKHSEILVARVVCRVQQGLLPVRVINVTTDNLPLKSGMKLGTLFTDIEVETESGDGDSLSGETLPPWTIEALMNQFGVADKGLGTEELSAVKQLLSKNISVFSRGDTDLGRTALTPHEIDTGDAKPIKMHPRRVPLHLQQEVADNLKQMLDSGVISPSCSPWAAPVVLVKKKGGGLRFCVDYRKLNEVTVKDAYPLPRIDDALDSLSHASWFSTLDLSSGYWQLEVSPNDRQKTAFTTRQGLFEFNVLSFGLCNAPSTFQRLMDLILADLQWTTCLVYLDDIIVFGSTFQEHLLRLDGVLDKLRQANLKVKPSKCSLFSTQVQYLGHVISAEGVMPDPAKVQSVKEWPAPTNQTEVKSFIGLASYYRRFIKGFADIARPLHQLAEKGRRFRWNEECQCAFDTLKTSLVTAPVLAYPDPKKPFILDTDASDVGVGAVLSQEEGGQERVIAYASRALTKQERKYATTKKELLSMVTFTKYFRHYLLGREFVLRTDHNSLRWLHNFQGLEGQLARWVEQLANFQYKIIHRPGKLHANADALSRHPAFTTESVTETPQLESSDPQLARGPFVGAVQEARSEAEPDSEPIDDELARAQREDEEIMQLIELKRSGGQVDLPKDMGLQKYANVWPQLQMHQNRLVRVPPNNSDASSQPQVILPKAMVPNVLAQLHNTATGGHLGIQKLQGKVKDRFYWPGWFTDVKAWVRECVDCGSRKTQGKHPCAPLQSSVTSRPFERVALDILGPLPETAAKNKYILVVGDYFSKWTEAYALPNQEAQTVAKVVAEQWVCRFGTPRTLHSDQGRNFESNVFRELCALLDIHKTRTSPYHPQSDGLIERFNRTLLSMLSLFVEDNQLNWDSLLPYVMLAYRSSVHASTSFTPYNVLFGREVVLPLDIMLRVDNQEPFLPVSEYVSRLRDTLSTVVEAVKGHQAKASRQQKTAYDFRANFQYYSEGELVWLQTKAKKRGICPKLQRRYKGPYRITDRVSEVLYRLIPLEGGPETVVHFNRLKPYTCSLTETEPRAAPRRSDSRYPVPPGRHQSIGVQYDTSWIHHRPPVQNQTTEGMPPARAQNQTTEGMPPTSRPASSSALPASRPASSSALSASRPASSSVPPTSRPASSSVPPTSRPASSSVLPATRPSSSSPPRSRRPVPSAGGQQEHRPSDVPPLEWRRSGRSRRAPTWSEDYWMSPE